MIPSRAGRNRSFCRSSRGFDIASPEQSPLDQGITIRLKSESQTARNPSPIPPFRQNRLLAQARLSLCPSDIQILHGRLRRIARFHTLGPAEAVYGRKSLPATSPPQGASRPWKIRVRLSRGTPNGVHGKVPFV